MFAIYSTCKMWYVPYCDRVNCVVVIELCSEVGVLAHVVAVISSEVGVLAHVVAVISSEVGVLTTWLLRKRHAPSGETPTIDRLSQRRLLVNEIDHIDTVLFNCCEYSLFNSFTVT